VTWQPVPPGGPSSTDRAGEPGQADEITRWIRGHAHPLTLVDASGPLHDLEPLADVVGQAVVVGLARPTHGAHELSTLTHQILRYLVEELGFRTLAIEEDWTTGTEIDAHLRTGTGDLRVLLDLAFPQWQNEEFLDVLRWMRTWNQRHPDDHLRIVGLDVSGIRSVAYDHVSHWVRRHAPDLDDELETHLATIRPTSGIDEHTERYVARADKQPRLDHARCAADLVDALPARDGHALASHHARVIVAYHELHALEPVVSMTYLEARLAENLVWWHHHTGTKILYWSGSHSAVGHARRVDFGASKRSETSHNAGSHLREQLGSGYRSGALTLHDGAVQVGATVQTVPAPPAGRPDAVLGTAGPDRFLLDLHAGDQPAAVRSWLRAPAELRLIGPGYRPADDATHHMSGGAIADWFDFIIHDQRATPTRPLAGPTHRP
jgi:erythromycin esterase